MHPTRRSIIIQHLGRRAAGTTHLCKGLWFFLGNWYLPGTGSTYRRHGWGIGLLRQLPNKKSHRFRRHMGDMKLLNFMSLQWKSLVRKLEMFHGQSRVIGQGLIKAWDGQEATNMRNNDKSSELE